MQVVYQGFAEMGKSPGNLFNPSGKSFPSRLKSNGNISVYIRVYDAD